MLSPEELQGLNNVPLKEALNRPLKQNSSRNSKIANLLAGGEDREAANLTIGDMLFRWARVEPEILAETDIAELKHVSNIVGSTGRLPKRLNLTDEVIRSGEQLAAGFLSSDSSNSFLMSYFLQRIAAHQFAAQGCEANICGASTPGQILLNGLQALVHDPREDPPQIIDKLTIFSQTISAKTYNLLNHPMVLVVSELAPNLPGPAAVAIDRFFEFSDMLLFAHAVAQAGQIILKRDKLAAINVGGLASTSFAGHAGSVAGAAAAAAILGTTGSWLIVLAPIAAGFGGRVAAKNLVRRARYHLFCRREEQALKRAISKHCIANRDALQKNIKLAESDVERFKNIRETSGETMRACIDDWLDRLAYIQQVRRVNADRFDRAHAEPTALDHLDGDIVVAAEESLLAGARVGLLPVNVASTANEVVTACRILNIKMNAAVI